jgi:acetoin utilization protein AcuC
MNMFGELLPLVEHLTDSLGMDMIVADLLTYCNAIRYEQLGFDYQSGMRLMQEIDREFQPDGRYFNRLDGSTPFRQPGMEKTVCGRSWAIYDGILDEPWDNVQIYKIVGIHAGINTFPGRERSRNS